MTVPHWKQFEKDFTKIVKGKCINNGNHRSSGKTLEHIMTIGKVYTLGVRHNGFNKRQLAYYILDDDTGRKGNCLANYVYVLVESNYFEELTNSIRFITEE